MTAPTYAIDLQDITLAESTTGWSALGGGASGLGIGSDFAMQGTNCVDKQVTIAEKGQIYNNGSAITPAADEHFFVWAFLATPGVTNTLANRGLGIVLGSGATAYNTFHVEGSDTYGAAGRVGRCYPIRYRNDANASAPYRTLTGSPGANPQYFGATANITGAVKSSNLGVDAIRRGTGMYITAGDVTTPANFINAAVQNDNISNRWGVLSKVGGGFELQGKLVIGQNSSKTATAAYFSASNAFVSLVDTPHSLTDFTQIIVDHASTVANLTNITFKALGSNNPGQLIFINSSTSATLTGCTFDGLGISTLKAAVTAVNTAWIGCNQITTNGAVLSGCTIQASANTDAVVINSVAEMNALSECSFNDNTRAIKLTAAGTYTFNGHDFSGNTYDVDNASGGAITINATNGCNVSTYINSSGGSTTIQNSKSKTFTGLPSGTEVRVRQGSYTLDHVQDVTSGSYTYSYNVSDKPARVQFTLSGYTFEDIDVTLDATDQSIPITYSPDPSYI